MTDKIVDSIYGQSLGTPSVEAKTVPTDLPPCGNTAHRKQYVRINRQQVQCLVCNDLYYALASAEDMAKYPDAPGRSSRERLLDVNAPIFRPTTQWYQSGNADEPR